jgi:hypothetical protein
MLYYIITKCYPGMCASVNDENGKAVMDPEAHCVQYTPNFI